MPEFPPDKLPRHWLELIEIARTAGCYSTSKGTNGQKWCEKMVEMGLLRKRGVYMLEHGKSHTDHAAEWPELHVFETTVAGRELIGRPYTIDPTWSKTQAQEAYEADPSYGIF